MTIMPKNIKETCTYLYKIFANFRSIEHCIESGHLINLGRSYLATVCDLWNIITAISLLTYMNGLLT